jgi:hypothetical protein
MKSLRVQVDQDRVHQLGVSSKSLVEAILLTLLFLPALYVAWFRVKEPRKEPEPRLGAGMPATAQ